MSKQRNRDLHGPVSATLLRVGQRGCRKDSETEGTVVEADGEIKVNWDDGSTSYFKRGMTGNVRVKPLNSD
jgi:hypothetical protein